MELEDGYVPLEIKLTERVSARDARHLRRLEGVLDKPVLHALVLSNDAQIQHLADGITAVPVAWSLG